MFTAAALASWLTVLEPILTPLFNAFGVSFNDWLERKRNEQALQDLGRVTAERDQAQAGKAATQAELDAAVNAPKSTQDAIARLEAGTA